MIWESLDYVLITFQNHIRTDLTIWTVSAVPYRKKMVKKNNWKKGSVFCDLYHYLFVLSPSQQLYPSIGSWLSQLGMFYCYIDRNRVIDYFLFLLDLSILWWNCSMSTGLRYNLGKPLYSSHALLRVSSCCIISLFLQPYWQAWNQLDFHICWIQLPWTSWVRCFYKTDWLF